LRAYPDAAEATVCLKAKAVNTKTVSALSRKSPSHDAFPSASHIRWFDLGIIAPRTGSRHEDCFHGLAGK